MNLRGWLAKGKKECDKLGILCRLTEEKEKRRKEKARVTEGVKGEGSVLARLKGIVIRRF